MKKSRPIETIVWINFPIEWDGVNIDKAVYDMKCFVEEIIDKILSKYNTTASYFVQDKDLDRPYITLGIYDDDYTTAYIDFWVPKQVNNKGILLDQFKRKIDQMMVNKE